MFPEGSTKIPHKALRWEAATSKKAGAEQTPDRVPRPSGRQKAAVPGSMARLVWEEALRSLGSCPLQCAVEPGLANAQSREVSWTVCGVWAMGPATASMTTAPHGTTCSGSTIHHSKEQRQGERSHDRTNLRPPERTWRDTIWSRFLDTLLGTWPARCLWGPCVWLGWGHWDD